MNGAKHVDPVQRGRGDVMFTFRLVRWNNLVINPNGPLGYRLLRQYIDESARMLKRRQRVAREWATYP
jgi:hypothetical protein